jgi:hypothetical protein
MIKHSGLRRLAVVAAIAVLLAAVLVLVTRHHKATGPRDLIGKLPPPGAPGTTAPAASLAAPVLGHVGSVTFAGRARSLETTVPVPGLQRVTLAASPGLVVHLEGEISNADGKSLGRTLDVSGPRLTVVGLGPLTLAGRMVMTPQATVLTEATYLTGADARVEGGAIGPVTVHMTSGSPTAITITGQPAVVTWIDAPTVIDLKKVKNRQDLSWAGSSSLKGSGLQLAPEWAGLRTHSLDVRIDRLATEVQVSGTADPAQVYANGYPQLATTMSVTRAGQTTTEVTAKPGGSGGFDWRVSNTGNHADLNILQLRPDSDAAHWLSLGLDHGPDFWGGERRAKVGGEAAGFRPGKPIDATIARYHGDTRGIRFTVPAGTRPGRYTIAVAFAGNFAPLTFQISVVVT